MANENRLEGLGPSFGTKYLYFCPQLGAQHPALILDRLVDEWLGVHTDLNVDTRFWSSRTYARYIQQPWSGPRRSVNPPTSSRSVCSPSRRVNAEASGRERISAALSPIRRME